MDAAAPSYGRRPSFTGESLAATRVVPSAEEDKTTLEAVLSRLLPSNWRFQCGLTALCLGKRRHAHN